MNTPHGPYGTAEQVAADLAALYERAQQAGESDMRRAQVRLLLDTLARLGVEAGSYDELILASIGQWEPRTTVVLAGLIERTHAAAAAPKKQETKPMNGPYETSREAFDAARVLRETVAAADPGTGPMTEGVIAARTKARVQYVRGVLEVCGVQLGAYDKRIAEWVAGWEVETIQAITGWIERARAAGRATPREAEAEAPVISWVVYRPQPGSEILEPAGVDGDVSPALDPGELAVDKLVEYATGAWDRVVKVYGTRGQLAAWAQWEDGEAVAYRNGDAR